MTRSVFSVSSTLPILARVPLLPANGGHPTSGADGLLTEGMFLASRHVDRPAEHPGRPEDHSRLAGTHRAYQIRASLRPTPHGTFAGVALTQFASPGEVPTVRLGTEHRARTNPSAAWLAALRDQILADPAALSTLTLSRNTLVTRRGSRLVHERPPSDGSTPHQVSIRATAAVTLILSMCQPGATGGQVCAKVAERWPGTERMVRTTLSELVRDGFLLTDLLPDDLTDDPVGHLLDRLTDDHQLRAPLTRLRSGLADADGHRPGDPRRLEALTAARDLTDQICLVERPLSADAAADARLVMPASMAAQAAATASVLWRIGFGRCPLDRYHERFLDRYGVHRFVALPEVTDPAVGLGLDALDDELGDPPEHRRTVLAGLLARATATSDVEVVLNDADVAALAGGQPDQAPPRTAEITVRVIAASPDDLSAGRLHLAVGPRSSAAAGSALGRFTSLLHPTGADSDDHALVAEVAVSARVPVGAAIAPPTRLASWRIPVGVASEPGDLLPDDLLVGSDGRRLVLWSPRHDRQVIPVLYSRITPRLLPPLARFLHLLGRTGHRPMHGWSWSPADHGPFTPRVRYRQTVLAPARWILPPLLIRASRDVNEWPGALDHWRADTVPAPPDVVVVDDNDRLLPLNAGRADDRELLRRYVCRGVRAVLEPPGGPDAVQAVLPGPAGSHLLELVVPLTRRDTPPAPRPHPARPVRATGVGLHLPGGTWLSLAIHTPAGELLLPELACLAHDLTEHYDLWFWLRYHTPELGPHFRIRFHGDPVTLGACVLPAVAAWCHDLIRQRLAGGFTVEPYDQEIERYGGPAAIDAAEQVFAADSELALAILTSSTDTDQRLITAAVSTAAIATTLTDDPKAALADHHLDRTAHRHMLGLRPRVRSARAWLATGSRLDARPDGIANIAGVARLGGGQPDRIDRAWIARHDALTAYRTTLHPERICDCASSVIHMHLNRLFGDRRSELMVRALAADLLSTPG